MLFNSEKQKTRSFLSGNASSEHPRQPRPASSAVRTIWKDGLTDVLHSVIARYERDRKADAAPFTEPLPLIETALHLKVRRGSDSSDTGWFIETVDTGTRLAIFGWGEGAEESLVTIGTNGRQMTAFAVLARRLGIKEMKTTPVKTEAIDEDRSAHGSFWDPVGAFTGHEAMARAKYLAQFGLAPGDVTIEALHTRGDS